MEGTALKWLVAPDKFKDSLTATQAAHAIAEGVRRAHPRAEIDLCPMADGGEGTVEALVAATGGRIEKRHVTGPLPEMKVDAAFGVLGDGKTAVVEMSAASGLALLKPQDRNPLNTTTFGTGELLVAAATIPGIEHIILGIGGSATTDAGIGCAQACGLPVILEHGDPVAMTEPLCGRDLSSIVLIKHGRGSPVERLRITVACDVTNPLFGPTGAAPVFGPQKGASPDEVKQLDELLRDLATHLGKLDEARTPGAGAAGGLGFGMLACFPNATLRPGFEIVAEATRLRERLTSSSMCLTGEGRLDETSTGGKVLGGVARLCADRDLPCYAFVGAAALPEGTRIEGLTGYTVISPTDMPAADAMKQARSLLSHAVARTIMSIGPRR
jgi:glycerate kinase